MNRIYLAGPISGLTPDMARYGWRADFKQMLREACVKFATPLEFLEAPLEDAFGAVIEVFSPMRGKDGLTRGDGVISSDPLTYGDDPMSSPSAIVCRDGNDVRRADVMVACFLEAEGRPSLGTAWEMGICHERHTPVVMIALPGDPHLGHVILKQSSGVVVNSLQQGVRTVRLLLLPGL